jgi:hypothetical protein
MTSKCGTTTAISPYLAAPHCLGYQASMSITRGREEKDKAKKSEHFSEAAKQLSNAKVLDDQEQLVHLGLGLLALAKVGLMDLNID